MLRCWKESNIIIKQFKYGSFITTAAFTYVNMKRYIDINYFNPSYLGVRYIIPTPLPGGSELIISVGDYVDNSFTALGSSDPREIRLEL